MKKLKQKYKEIVQEYIKEFERKHELEFDFWIGDEVGSIAQFGDYFFNFSDIIIDIDNKEAPELIIKWYDECLENKRYINYRSYAKGLRYRDLTNKKSNK